MTFTQTQLNDFKAYKAVQMSGAYNMFDKRAIQMTGLTRAAYLAVMENYDELSEAANRQVQPA